IPNEQVGSIISNENSSNEVPTTTLESIYDYEDKVQEDLDLIALVEGNPKLYAKRKAGYRNTQEKDMAWITIGKAMKYAISGKTQMRNIAESVWSRKARNNGAYETARIVSACIRYEKKEEDRS
ncbi:hypothetical protein X777_12226, partial [Ooceraea biroi]